MPGPVLNPEVIVLTTAGRIGQVWPCRTSASLAGPQCGADEYACFPHAMSADGALYLAPLTPEGELVP